MSGPLVITPCGGRKTNRAATAELLYTGSYFRASLNAAMRLTDRPRIRILSALHGLITLDQVLQPYDLRMGQPGSVEVDTVRRQAAEQGLLEAPEVIALGGRAYRAVTLTVWPHAADPLRATTSMGDQIKVLSRMGATHVSDQ